MVAEHFATQLATATELAMARALRALLEARRALEAANAAIARDISQAQAALDAVRQQHNEIIFHAERCHLKVLDMGTKNGGVIFRNPDGGRPSFCFAGGKAPSTICVRPLFQKIKTRLGTYSHMRQQARCAP